MAFERETASDTGRLSVILFRLALGITFFVLIGRMFQLQVVEGETFRERSDRNRFRNIAGLLDTAVGDNRNARANGFLDFVNCGKLRDADPGHHAGGTN